MGTFLDHALKSSEGPEEWLDFFSLTGFAFAHYEGCNPVPGYDNLMQQDTYEKMIAEASRLNIIDRLQAFSIAANSISSDKKGGSYYIVILDPNQKTVLIESFARKNLDEANKRGVAELRDEHLDLQNWTFRLSQSFKYPALHIHTLIQQRLTPIALIPPNPSVS